MDGQAVVRWRKRSAGAQQRVRENHEKEVEQWAEQWKNNRCADAAEMRVTRNLVWWEYIGFGTADAFLTFLLPLVRLSRRARAPSRAAPSPAAP